MIRAYTPEAFIREYLAGNVKRFRATVLHHTLRPRACDYTGIETVQAIRNYHMRQRGFSDISAHLYVAPDGTCYSASALDDTNAAHAYISRPWNKIDAGIRRLAGRDRQFFNRWGFGIEMIADFDRLKFDPEHLPKQLDVALDVLAFIHIEAGLPVESMVFHRDVAEKSCPGWGLKRPAIRALLAERMRKAVYSVPDVDAYAVEAVDWAKETGLMAGVGPDRFGGREPVKRQDMAVILKRFHDMEAKSAK